MLRRLAILVLLLLSTILAAQSAMAAECRWCLDAVALQTRDGQAWTAGRPVTLVVHVLAASADNPLPQTAQVVVMQTDGDRTKCLGVPLKLVAGDASGGVYAGLFFPFRPAHYDGVLVVGGDVQTITFDVNHLAAGAAPAGDLPAAEPIDTSAPAPVSQLAVLGAVAIGLAFTVALLYGGRRRLRRVPVM